MSLIKVKALDHVVFNVADMETIMDFYTNILGLSTERWEAFQAGEVPFPSVRVNQDTIIDFFPLDTDSFKPENSGGQVDLAHKVQEIHHVCLTLEKTDMDQLVLELENKGIEVYEGPVKRFGARGQGTSIYITDPEKRIIELRTYGE